MFKAIKVLIYLVFIIVISCDDEDPSRIGNSNTNVFHTVDCYYVKSVILPEHKVNFATREDALAAGYRPDESNKCNP